MRKLLEDVAAFHRATDCPVFDKPTMPDWARRDLRMALIDEEINRELLPAMSCHGGIEDIADALADSIYVLVGAALEYGIPLDRVWHVVHASNMTKIHPATGKVKRRVDGKILKPESFRPPDITAALWP